MHRVYSLILYSGTTSLLLFSTWSRNSSWSHWADCAVIRRHILPHWCRCTCLFELDNHSETRICNLLAIKVLSSQVGSILMVLHFESATRWLAGQCSVLADDNSVSHCLSKRAPLCSITSRIWASMNSALMSAMIKQGPRTARVRVSFRTILHMIIIY